MNLTDEGYWDRYYELELQNYEDDGDEGEVWFGRGLSKRIAEWLSNRFKSDADKSKHSVKVVDVGCGNSFMLISLHRILEIENTKEFNKFELLGIDYSEKSIELSQRIIQNRQLSDTIKVNRCDFLDIDELNRVSQGSKFDVIVDKGTYDAICLLANNCDKELTRRKQNYLRSLFSLAKSGSLFVMASCNHTEEELSTVLLHWKANGIFLKREDKIETPKLKFGGKEGSQVTCLIMKFVDTTES